jgi:hypothetical protein
MVLWVVGVWDSCVMVFICVTVCDMSSRLELIHSHMTDGLTAS